MCLGKDAALVFTFHILENIIIRGELRGSSPPTMYIAIEYAVYVMLLSAQDHLGAKMFLMIIFQGVHSFSADNCLMG